MKLCTTQPQAFSNWSLRSCLSASSSSPRTVSAIRSNLAPTFVRAVPVFGPVSLEPAPRSSLGPVFMLPLPDRSRLLCCPSSANATLEPDFSRAEPRAVPAVDPLALRCGQGRWRGEWGVGALFPEAEGPRSMLAVRTCGWGWLEDELAREPTRSRRTEARRTARPAGVGLSETGGGEGFGWSSVGDSVLAEPSFE